MSSDREDILARRAFLIRSALAVAGVSTLGAGVLSQELADRDGDGLSDNDDLCPDAAEDLDLFEDADGCPETDNDKDGIEDIQDKCPNEPEVFNGLDDQDGCPDQAMVQVCLSIIEIRERVRFDRKSVTIIASDIAVLDAVVRILLDNPTLNLEIEGHTDNQGVALLNMKLGMERAMVVRKYLVSHGVPQNRLSLVSHGDTRPINTNATAAGRANNNRVEFRLP